MALNMYYPKPIYQPVYSPLSLVGGHAPKELDQSRDIILQVGSVSFPVIGREPLQLTSRHKDPRCVII